MRITFCAAASSSAVGSAVASGAAVFSPVKVSGTSVGGDSGAAIFVGGAGFGGVGGVSSEVLIREMGGKTARFGFTSPSSVFLLGFFRSMSETLSASRVEGRSVSGADFESEGVRGLAGGATSSFNFCFGSFVLAAAAGLRAAAVPRAAGLRVAVLLLVFVAIVVRLKFCSWPELP
jgi:hypothetical protein